MAEAQESAAVVTETKKFVNSRVEIDTSPPFESVKEAVDHFGGGCPWIPHHMLRLAPNHHESEVINLDKVEEQASQLEKDLLKKKQETLHVLQELDAAKRFVESLKLNLMQEMSTFMAPEAHCSAGSLSWCPPAASPGSISMELNQAKINLGKTTTNLAVIQASVESLSRKIKDEQNLLDKVTERKAMDFYGSNMVPRQRCLVNDTTNGSAMNVSNDQQEPTFEAEQFKKMTEASKYEVMKAMSEIERTKTSIKMAEMRLNAARKMEEAAKAVEAIALAEKYTESSGISSHKSDGNGITLSFEEYNALTHKAQQAEESSCRTKFIDSDVRTNQSEASIMKKLDAARRRKKSLEEVMGREDYFDRRIRGNGNNYSGETIENEQTQNEDQNAGRFRFKNSRLQPLDENENENENESNPKTSPVYRSTISIGDILGRKLILQDDIVVGKHMERHAEREQVSLSQMLREQSGLILHPPPNSSMDQERGAEKQYYTQRKKFGFIHISIPRQSKKKAQRLKRLEQARKHPKRRLVISNATESSANGSSDGFPSRPGKIFKEEAIGAEYGEGFETFRPDGLFKVDVDFLNDKLQEGFLQRIRYAMKPDEAHGLIFSLDNVLVDTKPLKLNAWKQLASEEGKEIPSGEGIPRLLLNAGVEDVLDKVLMWEKSDNEVQKLKQRLSQLYRDNLLQFSEPVEGLKDWLDAVSTARIPCAVVSSLDRKSLVETLERIGLMKYFQAIVSEEDGAESISHRFLSAAVKLDRKPSKCVVFEDDPRGITAAHNCTMMAIALIGTHPKYDLGQADLTVGSFHELSVINLRRLFAHRGSCFMDLQKQVADKIPPRRKLSVDTIF